MGKNIVYKTDYNIIDMWKFYRDTQREKGLPVLDLATYRKVIKEFNTKVCNSIVENSDEFRLPFRLGYLRIRKFKTKYKLDHNGKLKTNMLKPNWVATKELWETNEKAKEDKKIVYHTNSHTDGYYYKWYWDKRVCNIKNSSVYSLVMTRANSRKIANVIKNNDSIDYFE